MNFFQRLHNFIFGTYHFLLHNFYTLPKQNGLLQKYFPGSPDLKELMYNASLILLNSHVSTNEPVAHVPNMIEIGGFHVEAPKKLPGDLQKFLDDARHGAIFFSLGSNIKSESLPRDKVDSILAAFSKIKQRVLWKWDEEAVLNLPGNVKLRKWFPQPDILGHRNLKLFITHSGLLSTIEAIYHGILMIVIPIFGDQKMNAARAQFCGSAITISYDHLTENMLLEALQEVFNNSSYAENAKKRSKVMHDQPLKPMENAVFWIEYVIRHRGAVHFKSAALDLAWYQYFLLDVVAFLTLFLTLVLVCVNLFIRKILFCCKMFHTNDAVKKHN